MHTVGFGHKYRSIAVKSYHVHSSRQQNNRRHPGPSSFPPTHTSATRTRQLSGSRLLVVSSNRARTSAQIPHRNKTGSHPGNVHVVRRQCQNRLLDVDSRGTLAEMSSLTDSAARLWCFTNFRCFLSIYQAWPPTGDFSPASSTTATTTGPRGTDTSRTRRGQTLRLIITETC